MKKEHLYKIGNRVRIKNSSTYYVNNDYTNPKSINGTIIEFYTSGILDIHVKWDNGRYNVYNERDLELVESKSLVEETKIEEVKKEVKPRKRLLLG